MRKSSLFLLLGFLSLYSCRRADRDLDRGISETKDQVFGTYVWLDVFSRVREACSFEPGLRMLECANIMIDTLSSPMSILMDFGSTDCTGNDGRTRSGKIFASLSSGYNDSATVVQVQLQNYRFNRQNIQGQMTITNNGRDSQLRRKYAVSVQQSTIQFPASNRTSIWSSSLTLLLNSGEASVAVSDDSFLVSGTFSGRSSKGNLYTANTSQTFSYQLSCGEIVSGSIDILPENLNKRVAQFGNGNCDAIVSVNVNGFEEAFNPESID